MNKRKGLFVLIMILGLSVLLVGQFSGTKEKRPVKLAGAEEEGLAPQGVREPGDAATELRVSVSLGAEEWESLQALTDEFMRTHNGITVQLENVPAAERYTTWKKAGQFGTGPDLMLLDNGWVQEFAALGFLYPVSEFYTTDKQSQYLPAALDQVKWNGYLWGVPKDIDPYILVWNRSTVEENGWKKAPTTGAEMIEWNRKLMNPDKGTYGIYFDPRDYMSLLSVFTSFVETLPEDSNPLALADEPNAREALQDFLVPQKEEWDAALFTRNFPLKSDKWDPWAMLAEGKLAAMVTTVSEYRRHSSYGVELSSLPMPGGGKSRTGSWLKGRSYCLSSHTVNSAAAMEWVKAVTGSEAETREWTDTGMLPVLLSSYTTVPLLAEEKFKSYSWLVQEGRALPFSIDSASRSEAVVSMLRNLAEGKLTLDQVTKNLVTVYE
ncbi:sugar ABC transporter substrate-binding protein [Gorillibacterium timonense]|uniref:sugar ABC transporter substrate-binding protein n=1 Tax=Gorillibacterium timonense TaxID=1689269 RepID=UPI00071D5749|nr:extracellular solute-binding protein [Gorillibacterium timonense]